MKNNFKFITVIMVILCIFCSSITAFAEPIEEQSFDKKPQTQAEKTTEKKPEKTTEKAPEKTTEKKPEKATTTEKAEEKTTKPHTTEESTKATEKPQETERETEKRTEPHTEEKTTKPVEVEKPVVNTTAPTTRPTEAPTTTRAPEEATTKPEETEEETEEESETTTEEEESLPAGSFYVYLERNNGMPRLKTVLTKPELVSEPDLPAKEGYIFDGWYADPEFTKKWDFYKDFAQKGTVIYAKWVEDPSATFYKINVKATKGGVIEVDVNKASPGEPVTITIKPEEGKRLVAGSLTVNGKKTDVLSFLMPNKNVVITGKFEDIPEIVEEEEEKSYTPFIVGGVVLVLVIGAVIFFIMSRRDDFDEDEIDENGTVIDDDTDRSWVDESIVVEDGFRNGEKVIGNFIPEDDFDMHEDDE